MRNGVTCSMRIQARLAGPVMLLGVLLSLLTPVAVRGQVDPLVDAGITPGTRVSFRLGHTFDAVEFAESDLSWRSDDVTLLLSLERPVTDSRVLGIAALGSYSTLRTSGSHHAAAWALDQLSVTVTQTLPPGWPGHRASLTGSVTAIPGRPNVPAAYQLQGSSVWLVDPLALELGIGLTAALGRKPSHDLTTSVSFVANRHLTLLARLAIQDLFGFPATSTWIGLIRQPSHPGDGHWGVGFERVIESGRTIPGLHFLLGFDL